MSHKFNELLREKYTAYRQALLTEAEIALWYFLLSHCVKYPQKNLERILLSDDVPIEQLLKTIQFKRVKLKAKICLEKWLFGEWAMQLIDWVPTPLEVLTFQARGVRPVTMLIDIQGSVLHKEDAFEFFIHDLEHGYMFFSNVELYHRQRKFFSTLLSAYSEPRIQKFLSHKQLATKFHYLMSDMNTHTEHYRGYLNALIPIDDEEIYRDLFEYP